jgi:hypothetical protein
VTVSDEPVRPTGDVTNLGEVVQPRSFGPITAGHAAPEQIRSGGQHVGPLWPVDGGYQMVAGDRHNVADAFAFQPAAQASVHRRRSSVHDVFTHNLARISELAA